ncbi:MAG: TSUP family transporter, partial [Alphaproteobacteria bacterium]|nr:TSUP family transporter [Alphaproteobacteria bacterium]
SPPPSRAADAAIGLGGGALGGFAGLSGPLPVIWLRLRGGSADAQRAVYQPFNLVVLALAAAAMAVSGAMDLAALTAAAICLPVALAAAWTGARLYRRIDAALFHRIVTGLLCLSGLVLIGGGVAGEICGRY